MRRRLLALLAILLISANAPSTAAGVRCKKAHASTSDQGVRFRTSGCGSTRVSAAVDRVPSTRVSAAVDRVLDQREEAIRAGNRQDFLDTIDPGADADFKARQARLFDGLRSVPLASFDLVLRTDDVPDLSAGLEDRYAADDVFLPPVEARYRVEGADQDDAIDTFFYTFLLREGRWRIVSDTDLDDLGLPSARNLWDFGPVALDRSQHFAILYNPVDKKRARALATIAEEGYGRMAEGFDRPVPNHIVVVLPHTLDQLREMLQVTFDLTKFVAFASASVDRDEDWRSTAPRVYVQDANLSRSRLDSQLETFHHEFVHVASFPLAGPGIPSWIHEGVADWMGSRRPPPEPVDASDSRLPDDYEFTSGASDSIIAAYEESTSAMAFLAEKKGKTAPLDLLARVGEARVAPGTSDYLVDQGLRAVYGAGLDDFQRDWNGGR